MNERKQKGGIGPGLQQNDACGDVVHPVEATTGINWTSAFPLPFCFEASPSRLATLVRTACLEQLGCSGTFLNHGLGKPPRLRLSAIGSMRRAASWSRASSEGPFPQRAPGPPSGRVSRLRLAGSQGRHQISSVPVCPPVG